MAAFAWPGGCPDPKPEKPLRVKNQSHFYLHDLDELRLEIEESERAGMETVWILNPGKGQGRTGVDLWYAKALLQHLSEK